MRYVNLGKTGLRVSPICLGMMTYGSPKWRPWVLDEEASRPFIRQAVEAGINFFDTANMYSNGVSEELTGKLLKEYAKREEVVIATKVFFHVSDTDVSYDAASAKRSAIPPNTSGLSRKHIFDAVDASLKRLGTDYIDLYQIHRWDRATPIEETMEALHDLVKSGKVRYIGASSMWAWQFAKAQQVARENNWTRFVSMQNHYNLMYREEEREMIPLCQDQGVALIPWSPLARGFLAGNRKPEDLEENGSGAATVRAKTDEMALRYFYNDAAFKIVNTLTRVAQAKGLSNAQVAYAWLRHKGVTAPIVGTSKMAQLEEAIASTTVSLTAEEIEELEKPYVPGPILGHV
ncbi:aldo/keto reductase [Oxalobacter vibrioformis]|uniref:Aldo/keto reductase n=1 Tax=Oxalobacter vibrioformis TaxID=933080 RepID=A0A9E9LYX5_9BURK|nr:aldo/keto reductase [Oxalobacter vibrioformis]WAW11297.1 aldo/keto reductase [Oxalobacter vibrioformis]